ncbi:probable RNA-binding protein 46 [Caerostris darwini]|uniref:Probable RNA-binding protein 46 n=1 Tax=Caerostris darwini TaxID=1538125 RepID=A0AAV4UEL3_9ARAC|nr:probable RNA-binding protein 46 [Caerostris darwini]
MSAGERYHFVQVNGQRIYGPPEEWRGRPPPEKGCEVFIGSVPGDIQPNDLLYVFQQIGPVYQFRFMIDFNGRGRGFSFCTYTNKEDAMKAVMMLNAYEIKPNVRIGVTVSVDNRRIWVGFVPSDKTYQEIFDELMNHTKGVKSIRVMRDPERKDLSVVNVEYKTHGFACQARRNLLSNGVRLFNRRIEVMEWAEIEPDFADEGNGEIILHIRNLPLEWDDHDLANFFCGKGIGVIRKIDRKKDFILVHCFTSENAANIVSKLNETYVAGKMIEVALAKLKNAAPNKLNARDIQMGIPSQNHENHVADPYKMPDFFQNTYIQVLANMCVDKQFDIPQYVTYPTVGPDGSLLYTSKVSIGNFPHWKKKYGSARAFASVMAAQESAARKALDDIKFLSNCNF